MAGREFTLEPQKCEPIETPFRKIRTPLPVPDSLPLLQKLREQETLSMRGQPPVIWHKPHGFQIADPYGNQWLDWSSGVLVSNAGHNHPKIVKALREYLDDGRALMTYCFPNSPRAKLVEKIIEIAPASLDRVFLLTTGSESTEVAIKLARTHGIRRNLKKRYLISFAGGFHGRTYGAQMAGGILGGAEWIDPNPFFVQVPFPGSVEVKDKSFTVFTQTLEKAGVDPQLVAGFIGETFQGREAKLMPVEYARSLRRWCDEHDAALIFDEVQAGFARSGKLFAFQHYGIVPDMVCCGKGITSSLPLSAVIGRAEYLDQYGPGEMTSTHTGSPLPAVAALANIEVLLEEKLADNARVQGEYLLEKLLEISEPWRDQIDVGGIGLATAMLFFDNREKFTPDAQRAFRFCELSMQRGNLFFAPVGKGYGALKFCPPLCITREAIDDGLFGLSGIQQTLEEVMGAVPAGKSR